MTTIYLIRHAEAEGNLYRRIHGHYDSLVTLRGKQQIDALRKRFENTRVDAVYSSDLYRARATAEAVTAGRGLGMRLTPLLREVNMGVWEDLTWGEVERFEPEQLEYFNNEPLRWRIDGSESYFGLQNRIADILREIAGRHDGQSVAVVTHGSAIRSYLCLLLDIPPNDIRRVKYSDNTAVALLRVDGGVTALEYYSDNSHLPEEISTFAHQKWWRENTTFDSTNLRYVPFDLISDAERYIGYRGAPDDVRSLLDNARRRAAAHSRAVSLALIGEAPVGMLELDTKQGEDEKAGVIDFFYMIPEHRRMGMTVQLLGQAVSVYRPLGREKLRMAVEESNEQALRFCGRYGFVKAGERMDGGVRKSVLELDIKLR